MQRCWTCESEVTGYHYTCSRCEKPRARLLESAPVAEATTMSKFIDYSLTELFFGDKIAHRYIAADISSNVENIRATLGSLASLVEWGFEELSWKMGRMTDVLESIDHSLKTPDETKGNEYCLMAEEFRVRGLLPDSEKYFLRSLKLNPLNHRTYTGLAQTYLQMDKFDDARRLLTDSLPHAIDNTKKSQTHRLLGRISFVEGKPDEALEALQLSITISPEYALGHYDYARYCALTGHPDDCLNSLAVAIIKERSLAKLARNDSDLTAIRGTNTLLERVEPIKAEMLSIAPLAVRKYQQMANELDRIEELLNRLSPGQTKEHGRDIEACREQCRRARREVEKLYLRLKNGDHNVRFMFMFDSAAGRRAPVEQMTETATKTASDLEKRLQH